MLSRESIYPKLKAGFYGAEIVLSVIEIDEDCRDYWDTETQTIDHSHPFNSHGWGKVRAIDGWRAKHYLARKNGKTVGAVMLLIKRIAFLPVSIMYAPRGIVFDLSQRDVLRALKEKAVLEAGRHSTVFLRIDPNIDEETLLKSGDPFPDEGFIHLPYRWTYWNAPRDVFRVDLTRGESEEELLKLIDPKARTGVRKSKKEGVIIRPAENLEEVRTFYEVYTKFAVDKGFLFRGFKYQESLWNEFISRGNGILALAVYNGEVIGGQICLVFGKMCVEMHRGVFYQYRKLRVNEALVWDGIRWAKEQGCHWYCQRGIGSPSLQQFKQKFHPKLVSLVGYYDLPFYPRIYKTFVFFEFKILPVAVKSLMAVRKALVEVLQTTPKPGKP